MGRTIRKLKSGCWVDDVNCRASAHGGEPPESRSPPGFPGLRGLRVARVRAGKEVVGRKDLDAWMKDVADLPAGQQVQAVADRLREHNPGFEGKVDSRVGPDGVVAEIHFGVDRVTDISPLRALPGLTAVGLRGSAWLTGQLADLSPLRGMKLTRLTVWSTKVADLSPLAGMKLTDFNCAGSPVADLSPLRGMPLEHFDCQQNGGRIRSVAPLEDMPLKSLNISGTAVADLSPLRGMKLEVLSLTFCPVSDLSSVKGMSLQHLAIQATRVTDLSPLTGMPLKKLWIQGAGVSDLFPLKGMKLTYLGCKWSRVTDFSLLREMPLQEIECDFNPERDGAILRLIKTLQTINGKPAADFWKEVDAKK